MLGCVALPFRDDQTLRPAQSDDGVSAATTGGRPDAGDASHDESAQVNLHLILLPGDRVAYACPPPGAYVSVRTMAAHQVVVLARTSPPDPDRRHAGFSQFLVPCDADGVRIEPIVLMNGEHHFNEVIFDEVFVPDADVLGEVGNGWHQVTAELSFERSGPERMLSTVPLIAAAIRVLSAGPPPDDRTAADIGDLLARLISLRQLSVWVARTLSDGKDAANQAALVKDLGTRFEQESVGVIADLLDQSPRTPEVATLLATAWLHKPVFTLRGGTNEVLRGVIARGMGLR